MQLIKAYKLTIVTILFYQNVFNVKSNSNVIIDFGNVIIKSKKVKLRVYSILKI